MLNPEKCLIVVLIGYRKPSDAIQSPAMSMPAHIGQGDQRKLGTPDMCCSTTHAGQKVRSQQAAAAWVLLQCMPGVPQPGRSAHPV